MIKKLFLKKYEKFIYISKTIISIVNLLECKHNKKTNYNFCLYESINYLY